MARVHITSAADFQFKMACSLRFLKTKSSEMDTRNGKDEGDTKVG